MTTVRESCVCGATFEFLTRGSIEAASAAKNFRDSHRVCREKAIEWVLNQPSRLTAAEELNELNRQEVDALRSKIEGLEHGAEQPPAAERTQSGVA